MAEVPHFAYPLRYVGGRAIVNEQDSLADVADCVTAALLTSPGDRIFNPEYGVDDVTFSPLPPDLDQIAAEIEEWEPRARTLLEADEALFERAVLHARVTVSMEAPEDEDDG